MNTGDAELTKAAAGLLLKTGGDKAITALAALLGSTDPQIVEIAANALASTKGDVASAVASVIPTAGDAGKIAAIRLIAARRSSANAAAVTGALSSPSPEVRAAAFEALADVLPADEIFRLYEAADPAERHLYFPALATTGEAKALELIAGGFASQSGAAKDAAFAAMTSMNGTGAADKLLAIAKNPAEGAYFDRAISRYTRLVASSPFDGETRRLRLVEALGIARTDAQKSAILKSLGATGSYSGMIKAGEYLDDKGTQQAAAGAVMTIALANPQFTGTEVKTLLGKVLEVLDNPDADYQRKAIRKHLDETVVTEPFRLSDREKKEGFTVLFDGTNLDEWTGNKTDYRVENGVLTLQPSRGSGGNLYTAKEYGNFIYRFEFMLTPGANNGVGIRAEQGKDAAYHGMEIQILDHDDPAYRSITPLQVHGSVYGIIGAKRAVLKPEGEWNVEEIVADGDNIKVTLNGEVIVDGNIRKATKNGTADGHAHPGLFNKKGYIGFLGHGSKLKFRNIRIKELP